jgi:hypothetical protein
LKKNIMQQKKKNNLISMKHIFIAMGLLLAAYVQAQLNYSLPNVQLVTSQVGFKPNSPKTVTLFARNINLKIPDEIPFYIQAMYTRKKRIHNMMNAEQAKVFNTSPFRYPIEIAGGKFDPKRLDSMDGAFYKGVLRKKQTPWGTFWQGDFTDFKTEGVYQLECEYAFTTPFMIEEKVYDRLVRSYLSFIYGQRSGVEIPGVRPEALHEDDARLDSTGEYVPTAGGWYDAGDWRKWIALTSGNMEALSNIVHKGHKGFQQKALDELQWGNKFFQQMINHEGRVWEDVAGGNLRLGYTYNDGWWVENHPGCIANGGINHTDGIPNTGDERHIRMNYNAVCQYLFVRNQCYAYTTVPDIDKGKCIYLAEKGWKYGQAHNNDRRTLFVAEELWAAIELHKIGSKLITTARIKELVAELLQRQFINNSGLSGYFMEENNADGYRSIAFSSEPPLALLAVATSGIAGLENEIVKSKQAVTQYIESYLLADAKNNIFGYTPYGIYVKPPYPNLQTYRKVNDKHSVRSFVHVFADKQLPHGCSGVAMSQAYLMAKAGHFFANNSYKQSAEKLIQWVTGHNPEGLCLTTGVGYRIPVTVNYMGYKTPDAFAIGFLGKPNDNPYMETSNNVEWSTQEQWDVPFFYLVDAVTYINEK